MGDPRLTPHKTNPTSLSLLNAMRELELGQPDQAHAPWSNVTMKESWPGWGLAIRARNNMSQLTTAQSKAAQCCDCNRRRCHACVHLFTYFLWQEQCSFQHESQYILCIYQSLPKLAQKTNISQVSRKIWTNLLMYLKVKQRQKRGCSVNTTGSGQLLPAAHLTCKTCEEAIKDALGACLTCR